MKTVIEQKSWTKSFRLRSKDLARLKKLAERHEVNANTIVRMALKQMSEAEAAK